MKPAINILFERKLMAGFVRNWMDLFLHKSTYPSFSFIYYLHKINTDGEGFTVYSFLFPVNFVRIYYFTEYIKDG